MEYRQQLNEQTRRREPSAYQPVVLGPLSSPALARTQTAWSIWRARRFIVPVITAVLTSKGGSSLHRPEFSRYPGISPLKRHRFRPISELQERNPGKGTCSRFLVITVVNGSCPWTEWNRRRRPFQVEIAGLDNRTVLPASPIQKPNTARRDKNGLCDFPLG